MSRPQVKKHPITQADINEYLSSKDDFQLEIEVFRACLEAGFSAEHAGSYRDPVTEVNRQFDVRAFFSDGARFLRFAIECKSLSENFPLVVSRIPRRGGENYCTTLISRRDNRSYGLFKMKGGLFSQGELVGKSTAQVGRKNDGSFYSGDSEVYEKWAQAIASAHDLVRAGVQDCFNPNVKWASTLVLPILVLADKTLWVADHTADGAANAEPRQVDECSIYLDATITTMGPYCELSYPISHLLVFTKTGFFDFLRRFRNHGDVRDYLLPDTSEIVSAAEFLK